jgi:hypothetical protein
LVFSSSSVCSLSTGWDYKRTYRVRTHGSYSTNNFTPYSAGIFLPGKVTKQQVTITSLHAALLTEGLWDLTRSGSVSMVHERSEALTCVPMHLVNLDADENYGQVFMWLSWEIVLLISIVWRNFLKIPQDICHTIEATDSYIKTLQKLPNHVKQFYLIFGKPQRTER